MRSHGRRQARKSFPQSLSIGCLPCQVNHDVFEGRLFDGRGGTQPPPDFGGVGGQRLNDEFPFPDTREQPPVFRSQKLRTAFDDGVAVEDVVLGGRKNDAPSFRKVT
jgi:hypothetical protein